MYDRKQEWIAKLIDAKAQLRHDTFMAVVVDGGSEIVHGF